MRRNAGDLADHGGPADASEKMDIWLVSVLVNNDAATNHVVIIDVSSFDLLGDRLIG